MGKLEGRVAIITGAGSGVGRASARLFAREGATVVVADLVEKYGRTTVDLIGENATFIKTDVSSSADVASLIGETVDRFGCLDILFNNAGIFPTHATTVVDTDEADWDTTMAVNVKGVFLGVRHGLPIMMTQNSGVIINTASVSGIGAAPRMAAYCTSKGAVIALTRQLAIDYASYNIRVNCICPGGMEKPMGGPDVTSKLPTDALEARWAQIAQRTPLGRSSSGRELAEAALYLASDDSSYVTGTALIVDGGALAM